MAIGSLIPLRALQAEEKAKRKEEPQKAVPGTNQFRVQGLEA